MLYFWPLGVQACGRYMIGKEILPSQKGMEHEQVYLTSTLQ